MPKVKLIAKKQLPTVESDEVRQKSSNHKKKKIFKGKGDEKSLKNRRSNERRQNAKFFGVCLTCFQYGDSTIGEVSDFAYNHMCESNPENLANDLI